VQKGGNGGEMIEEKKKAIEVALQTAGLKEGKIVIGTYETGHEGKVGLIFTTSIQSNWHKHLASLHCKTGRSMRDSKSYDKTLALSWGQLREQNL